MEQEFAGLNLRLSIAVLGLRMLPIQVGLRMRVSVLRWAGISIGQHSVVLGNIRVNGAADLGNLTIGADCVINDGSFLDPSDRLEIGDGVALGHDVLVMTSSHAVGTPDRRHGVVVTAPVIIESGAWLSSRCVIQPGVTIGAGAIVLAGAVVTKSVACNTVVGGVPASMLWQLPAEAGPTP